jgi:hypothetical protein
VYDLAMNVRQERLERTDVPANAFRDVFTLGDLPDQAGVCFVRLDLADANGKSVSDNFYWFPKKNDPSLGALSRLPMVKLDSTFQVEAEGKQTRLRVKVTNPSDRLAMFVQVAATRGAGGEEILPVFWQDNYFSLLPGESKEIVATLSTADLAGAPPVLEVGGWNIETPWECRALDVVPANAKAAQRVTVSATIASTFLDGSRVTLYLDDQPIDSQFVWARGASQAKAEFDIQVPMGRHSFRMGSQSVQTEGR